MSIASNIATIFQRKRALKAEVIKPLQEQYIDIVRALARGDEIDESEVFEITDALAITEAKLSKDVATQQERFTLATQLYEHGQATEDIQELTRESEKLEAEYQAFMAKFKPKQNAVVEKRKVAELILLQTMHAESKLIATCLDHELTERTKELDAKRHKVGMEIRDLQNEVSHWRGRITYAKAMIDNVHSDNAKMPKAFLPGHQEIRDNYRCHQVELAKQRLASVEREAALVFAKFDSLKAEQQKLDAEIRELNKLKLVP